MDSVDNEGLGLLAGLILILQVQDTTLYSVILDSTSKCIYLVLSDPTIENDSNTVWGTGRGC